MALAEDLLTQSFQLANLDKGKPRQANLRRAVSAAYYAVFHLLVADASDRFSPTSPAGLSQRIARSMNHAEMKQVCRSIAEQHTSSIYPALVPSGFGGPIRLVADSFTFLQSRRHEADYDLSVVYFRVGTLDILGRAEDAFAAWRFARSTDEANVFLAALLFGNRWAK